MATQDEVLRVVMQVENEDRLRRLTESLKQQEAEVLLLTQTYGRMHQATQSAAGLLGRQQQQYQALQRQTRDYGQVLMTAGYATQDFLAAQGDLARGLMYVSNNIPMLLTGLGLGTGLAGVLSIGSAVVAAFTPQIIQFVNSLQADEVKLFSDSVAGLTATIEGLKGATDAVSFQALERAQDRLKALQSDLTSFQSAAVQPTAAQQAAAAAMREGFEDRGGAEGLADRVAMARKREQTYYSQEELTKTKVAEERLAGVRKSLIEEGSLRVDEEGNAQEVPHRPYGMRAYQAATGERDKTMMEAEKSARERIEAEVGRAYKGSESDIRTIQGLATGERTRGAFTDAQVRALEDVLEKSMGAATSTTFSAAETLTRARAMGPTLEERDEGRRLAGMAPEFVGPPEPEHLVKRRQAATQAPEFVGPAVPDYVLASQQFDRQQRAARRPRARATAAMRQDALIDASGISDPIAAFQMAMERGAADPSSLIGQRVDGKLIQTRGQAKALSARIREGGPEAIDVEAEKLATQQAMKSRRKGGMGITDEGYARGLAARAVEGTRERWDPEKGAKVGQDIVSGMVEVVRALNDLKRGVPAVVGRRH